MILNTYNTVYIWSRSWNCKVYEVVTSALPIDGNWKQVHSASNSSAR